MVRVYWKIEQQTKVGRGKSEVSSNAPLTQFTRAEPMPTEVLCRSIQLAADLWWLKC